MLLSAVLFALLITVFVESDSNGLTDDFLAGWPILALLFWSLSAAMLSLGGVGVPRLAFVVVCFLGALLSFVCFLAHLVAHPSAVPAAMVHLCLFVFIFGVWSYFWGSNTTQIVGARSILAVIVCALAVLLTLGMAAQAVNFATRYRSDVLQETLNYNDTTLYVDCSGPINASVIILIVSEMDHTSIFYRPLKERLLQNNGWSVCVYDSAGIGFSSAGSLPRTSQALGQEAVFVASYMSNLYESMNSTETAIAVGCGQSALSLRWMLQDPNAAEFFNGGIVLIDALSEFEPIIIAAALNISSDAYISSIADPLASRYRAEHFTAGMGSCLLDPISVSERFPSLPTAALRDLQVRARCNGGMQAAASASTAQNLYKTLVNSTLGDTPLLVLASGGPLNPKLPLGSAYALVQQSIYGLSSSSSIQIIDDSEHVGDLVVLHLDEVNEQIVRFVNEIDE